MPETPLPNNEAARSTTGEILEPNQITKSPAEIAAEARVSNDPTTTPPASSESTTPPTSTEPKPGETLLTDPKPAAVPEKYEAFKVPDGYTLSPETVDKIAPVLKELGLDQAGAQKLVDFHVAQLIESAKAPAATYEATRTEWQGKAKADPEMSAYSLDGKTGLDAVKIDLGRALNSIGDAPLVAEFKAAMDLTGAGDNPAFIKTFWKLAQRVTEGKAVTGGNPSPLGQRDPSKATKPTAAQSMYPNLASSGS